MCRLGINLAGDREHRLLKWSREQVSSLKQMWFTQHPHYSTDSSGKHWFPALCRQSKEAGSHMMCYRLAAASVSMYYRPWIHVLSVVNTCIISPTNMFYLWLQVWDTLAWVPVVHTCMVFTSSHALVASVGIVIHVSLNHVMYFSLFHVGTLYILQYIINICTCTLHCHVSSW